MNTANTSRAVNAPRNTFEASKQGAMLDPNYQLKLPEASGGEAFTFQANSQNLGGGGFDALAGGSDGAVASRGLDPQAAIGVGAAAVQDLGEGIGNISGASFGEAQGRLTEQNQAIGLEEQRLQSTPGGTKYSWLSQDLLVRPDEGLYTEDVAQIGQGARAGNVASKTLSRAGQGAAAGAALAGPAAPFGALIGGGIGAVAGFFEGLGGAKKMREMDAQAIQDRAKRLERRMKQWKSDRNSARSKIASETRQSSRDAKALTKAQDQNLMISNVQDRRASNLGVMGAGARKQDEYTSRVAGAGFNPLMAAGR